MKTETIDRETLRQYLLGRLDAVEEMDSAISDEIFRNDHLAEVVDSVEDEIIEEYAEGSLDAADRKSVEEYFLRSPDRRARLQFFRALQSHFETAAAKGLEPATDMVHRAKQAEGSQFADKIRLRWHHVLVWGQVAALVALCVVGISYVSGVRKQQRLLEADLARERARSATLAVDLAQRETASADAVRNIVGLTLAMDRSRAAGVELPQVELRPSTQRIMIEIALTERGAVPYEVDLETRDSSSPLWSAKLLPILSPSGDARLVFDVPAQGLKAGVYSIVTSREISGANWRRSYDFVVKNSK
jgi:hypothetical protein